MTVITDYIATVPVEHQSKATELYQLLKELLPTAKERMSYQMPSFWSGYTLIYFAAAKNHLGLYPTPQPIVAFEDELQSYKTSKGAIQLPYDQTLPTELITKIVEFQKQRYQVK
ncbi:iron chaperone [Lapidilactobacillus mulanensis]|uniref:Iron chaperone n=1 Tax=Lapidilactobacillus mulanensis TaxID=2485999 RepID=A0ABW4DP77_9LACO|nr:DUF1801 domain-containing protein [Lapidilactobacillus mulanensis]